MMLMLAVAGSMASTLEQHSHNVTHKTHVHAAAAPAALSSSQHSALPANVREQHKPLTNPHILKAPVRQESGTPHTTHKSPMHEAVLPKISPVPANDASAHREQHKPLAGPHSEKAPVQQESGTLHTTHKSPTHGAHMGVDVHGVRYPIHEAGLPKITPPPANASARHEQHKAAAIDLEQSSARQHKPTHAEGAPSNAPSADMGRHMHHNTTHAAHKRPAVGGQPLPVGSPAVGGQPLPVGSDGATRRQWILFGLAVVAVLGVEEAILSRMSEISMCTAVTWLGCCVAFTSLFLSSVGLTMGWALSAHYSSIILLNAMLSPDNLVVFMMFLKHAALPTRHHRRVISDGFLLAIALRVGTMLATSALLSVFSPLQLVLSLLVFAKGVQMTAKACVSSLQAEDSSSVAPSQEASEHWAVRALQQVLPVRWDEDSDGVCLIADRESGRLHVTRTTALIFAIGCSDLTFSSDNITAVLALTTDAFTLVSTLTLSILLLRPVYFLAASFVTYLDALDSALGVILMIIGGKLLLSQAGVEVPLWAVVSLLTVWRVGVATYFVCGRTSAGAGV